MGSKATLIEKLKSASRKSMAQIFFYINDTLFFFQHNCEANDVIQGGTWQWLGKCRDPNGDTISFQDCRRWGNAWWKVKPCTFDCSNLVHSRRFCIYVMVQWEMHVKQHQSWFCARSSSVGIRDVLLRSSFIFRKQNLLDTFSRCGKLLLFWTLWVSSVSRLRSEVVDNRHQCVSVVLSVSLPNVMSTCNGSVEPQYGSDRYSLPHHELTASFRKRREVMSVPGW